MMIIRNISVGMQLLNHIHGTAQPEFVTEMDRQSAAAVIARRGSLVAEDNRLEVLRNRSKYSQLGVARLIRLYKKFLIGQLVRFHAHP
jgi:hypothetical protein